MGFLGGLLGSGSGAGFQAQGTNILQPATLDQAQQAYQMAQQGAAGQQKFLEALASQGGVQNQQSVFNQLQGIANGTGPNLAGAQLANTTGANVANQAALMAGQRGASANSGLLARQAAMQGGNIQQQAAGQGAALQAQQQQQALAQLASISDQQVGQQQVAQQGVNQNAQGLQGNILGGINAQNNANVGMQSNINSTNAQIAAGNQKSQSDLFGGALNGAASAASMFLNHGGMVPHYAEGGSVAPQSFAGNFFNSGQQPAATPQSGIGGGMAGLIGGLARLAGGSKPVEQVPFGSKDYIALPDAGTFGSEQYKALPDAMPAAPQATAPQMVAMPQMVMPAQNIAPGAMVAAQGGQVPGRAQVQGDSLRNDKVPAVLSPGEIVIPRSVLQSSNPALAAAHFVEQEMAKHGKKMTEGGTVQGAQGGDSWADRWGKMAKGMRKADGGMIDPNDEEAGMQEFAAPALAAANNMGGASGEWIPEKSEIKPGSNVSEIPVPTQPSGPMMGDSIQGGFAKQKAGILGEANALAQQARDEQAITSEATRDLQTQQAAGQSQLKDLDGERQKLLADVQNSHIDPSHYLGSMSTGSKVSTAIGLILGGMGGGLTHQENPALKYLQAQIDNDIKAQTTDIGKKQNLLTANMQQFGNLKDAISMTKANMLDIASMRMKEAAAKAMDPLAKARGMQEAGKLDILAGEKIAPLKIKQAVLSQVNENSDPATLVPVLVTDPAMRGKVFDEIKHATNLRKASDQILKAFDKAASQVKLLPGDRSGVKAFKALIAANLGEVEGSVREAAMKAADSNLTPEFFDTDLKTKRESVKNWIETGSAAPTAKAYGIDLDKFKSTQHAPETKTKDGITYQKVQGGWKRVG